MKHLAAAVFAIALACATPACALTSLNYSPADMREMEARAKAGDVDTMIDLGKAYAYGRTPGNRTDRASALYWFGKAANLGSAEAQTNLGYLYADDEPRAFLWFQRAAEKGDVFAQGRLGRIYQTSPTLRDYGKGYHWTLKAALQGDDNAVVRLQTIYVYKNEVATFEAAMAKLSQAADAADKDAQWRLATVLMASMTTPEEGERARAMAEKAALQGSPEGLYLLACYVTPGKESLNEAERATRDEWLRKSADKGYVPAQLYWMSDYDSPLPYADTAEDPNERMIFDWLVVAAEKGWPMAQEALSEYYRRGLFVGKDGVEAYKWLMLARHLPYHRGAPSGTAPDLWNQTDDAEGEIEARRRAEAWLEAHPLQYWQVDEGTSPP